MSIKGFDMEKLKQELRDYWLAGYSFKQAFMFVEDVRANKWVQWEVLYKEWKNLERNYDKCQIKLQAHL